MKKSSAAGADGWRVAEIFALPDAFLDQLACILNLVEETGAWPQALLEGVISPIHKGEGSVSTKFRPIGIMSVVYRAWAAVRVRDLLSWQQSWIENDLHGYRKVHSP